MKEITIIALSLLMVGCSSMGKCSNCSSCAAKKAESAAVAHEGCKKSCCSANKDKTSCSKSEKCSKCSGK